MRAEFGCLEGVGETLADIFVGFSAEPGEVVVMHRALGEGIQDVDVKLS